VKGLSEGNKRKRSGILILEILVVGSLQVNCYILGCEKTKEAVVIDPGDNSDRIARVLDEKGLKLKYIINTHAHFDHVGGNAGLKRKLKAQIMLHEDDNFLFERLKKQADIFGYDVEQSPPADILLKDNDKIRFGELELDVMHTPGHSPGGISLKINNVVFTGDTLFSRSIGRTDLPGGSYEHLIRSIKERLFTLDDKTIVYPGHGESSTIGQEKSDNPYFQ
jgi:glyoxylase-like metal-dependent hydrolase (beta-lactamase superfamily II)